MQFFPWSVYAEGGPGLYITKNGTDDFGANVGFGINYEANSILNFEIGADYHYIGGNNDQFIQNHAGAIVRF